jgi:hypothetical protein
MLFYVVLGSLFSLYAVDLLVLVLVAMWARSRTRQQEAPAQVRRLPLRAAAAAAAPTARDRRDRQPPIPPPHPQVREGPLYTAESARNLHDAFPKVMIQLPMYNEEAVCDVVIDNCCKIKWPRDRLIIQVGPPGLAGLAAARSAALGRWARSPAPASAHRLQAGCLAAAGAQVCDDSTKEHIRRKVDSAAAAAVEAGHPVQVIRRDNRQGYKAGAMVEGLNRLEGQGYEFVAIFDAGAAARWPAAPAPPPPACPPSHACGL